MHPQASGQTYIPVTSHSDSITDIVIDPNQKTVFSSGKDGYLKIWK